MFNEVELNHHEQLMLIELVLIHEFHAEKKRKEISVMDSEGRLTPGEVRLMLTEERLFARNLPN